MLSFTLCLYAGSASSQNLITNGSFETYNACPSGFSGVGYSPTFTVFPTVRDWVRPTAASSDYLNACAISTNVWVPGNLFGWQQAHTGNAYCGFYTYLGPASNPAGTAYQEHLTTKLSSPMVRDSSYCVSFWVSTAGLTSGGNAPAAVNEIGAYFSNTIPDSPSNLQITLPYHIQNDTNRHLSDTSLWYEISGIYVASGGEQWMTIGTFRVPRAPAYTRLTSGTATNIIAYAYIDDVSVALATTARDTSITIAICDTTSGVLVSPSPAGPYQWSTGDTSRSITVSQSGDYICRIPNDCQIIVQRFHVTVATQTDSVQNIIACKSGSVHVVLSAMRPAGTYAWLGGETSATITATDTGIYICKVLSGCHIYKDIFHIVLSDVPAPVMSDTSICQFVKGPVLNTPASGLTWFTDATGGNGSLQQPAINTDKPGKKTYYVARKIDACYSDRTPINVTIIPLLTRGTGQQVLRCAEKDKAGLIIGNNAGPGTSYTWSTGSGDCCINPGADGLYVRVATNQCSAAKDSFEVVTTNCQNCIHVPDAFTPNGDGRNDGFKALLRCPDKEFYMRIYNRWGESVYVSFDKNQPWDGKKNGVNAPIGTYMYFIRFRHALTSEEIMIKGDLTLIR